MCFFRDITNKKHIFWWNIYIQFIVFDIHFTRINFHLQSIMIAQIYILINELFIFIFLLFVFAKYVFLSTILFLLLNDGCLSAHARSATGVKTRLSRTLIWRHGSAIMGPQTTPGRLRDLGWWSVRSASWVHEASE